MPAPGNGVAAMTDPVLDKPLTVLLPPFATHTLPEPSIAMLDGKSKPPAVKLVAETPSGAMRVALPVRFVTHALPERSIAIADGLESEPVVYPPAGDRAAPIGENSLALFAALQTHTLPVASIATPVG
jgi:hypothetical protein